VLLVLTAKSRLGYIFGGIYGCQNYNSFFRCFKSDFGDVGTLDESYCLPFVHVLISYCSGSLAGISFLIFNIVVYIYIYIYIHTCFLKQMLLGFRHDLFCIA
jgi:hypothetical protein